MTHQWIKITDIDKSRTGANRIPGVSVVCVECGEVRRAYEDGVMEVVKKSKTPCQNKKN